MAERNFLTERLAAIPAEARWTRHSLEARMRQIDERLAELPAATQPRSKVVLTFRGRPVIGSEGFFADFGMKAVSAFSEAVAAVAASLSAPLAATGPIPNRDANQLIITGTARGSFGFELQEPERADQPPPGQEPTPLSRALAHTQNLLVGTTSSDDELLADALAELDQRAVHKVRSFIAVLKDSDATCVMQYGDRSFQFNELRQVQTAFDRLSRDNLHEAQLMLEGHFEGLLPRRKTFEFRRADTGEVITGKLSIAGLRPEAVNEHLNERVSIRVVQTSVGAGKPRYLLVALPEDWGSTS